nr:MAG TPA: hypothetical protein [Caudoviricetes sp.]
MLSIFVYSICSSIFDMNVVNIKYVRHVLVLLLKEQDILYCV